MVLIALGLFGLIVVALAAWGYVISARTAEDYMLGGRTIGVVVMFFFVLFAVSSSWTFYGFPGVLYLHGPGYVFFIWGSVAGFAALYMFIGPRLWAVSRLNGFLSPVEALAERYESKALRLIISLSILAFIVPYVGIQPLGVGVGLEALTGMPALWGALYTAVLLVVIVLLGGMRIVAWVNILLGCVYVTALLGSLVWVVHTALPGGLAGAGAWLLEHNPEQLAAPGPLGVYTPAMICGTFVVGLIAFSWPHIAVGVMTARDKNLFKWFPLLIFVFGGLFFYLIPFLWGSIVAPVIKPGITDPLEADRVVQTIITEQLPAWFGVFVVMGVVAAAVSTAAVQLMTSSIIVARDLVQGVFKPDADDAQITRWARISVIVIIMLSLSISIWNTQALALYLTDISIPGFAQWAPALAGGLLWKRGTRQGAVAGTLVGVLYLMLGLLITEGGSRVLFFNLHPVMPTLLLNTLIYVGVSLCTPAPSEEIQSQFFDEVDHFLRAESRQ